MGKKNSKEELIRLVKENPNLPLVFIVNNEEIAGDYGSTVYENFYSYISEVYKYEQYGDMLFSDDEPSVVEYYMDYFWDSGKFSKNGYEELIRKWVNENVEHYKAIVVNVVN